MPIKPKEISLIDAKRLLLNCQGLVKNQPFGKGKAGIINAITHLGYIQIDAISTIERAHHHTIWNRVNNYKEEYLLQLISKNVAVFEYWHHAVAYLPMRHYRFHRFTMEAIKSKPHHWFQVSKKIKSYVFDTIKAEGPMFARDFKEAYKTKSSMWDLKPTKQALHELFMGGDIMVKQRHQFQRQYDITERVLPDEIDLTPPSEEELAWFFILSSLKAHGLMKLNEMVYLRNWIKPLIQKWLPRLIEQGRILTVQVMGDKKNIYYALPDFETLIPKRIEKKVTFLSPFDNAIIQRKRIAELFDFSYQTEIYLPSNKRKYGYFSMPILWGNILIGRIDPKADRVHGILIIKLIQIDNEIKITDQLIAGLKARMLGFSVFNGCETYQVEASSPNWLKDHLCRD